MGFRIDRINEQHAEELAAEREHHADATLALALKYSNAVDRVAEQAATITELRKRIATLEEQAK